MKKNLWALSITLGLPSAMVVLNGCVSLPPEVRSSVDATRIAIEQLHASHAQDARTFARMVERHTIDEIELRNAVRREAEARARAEVARFKAETMATYDRYAQNELGIQFQANVDQFILPPFDEMYAKDLAALVDATIAKTASPTDPATAPSLTTAVRNLDSLQFQKSTTIIYYYFELVTAISHARFNFETQVEQTYDVELKSFLAGVKEEDPGANQALTDFEANTDAKIRQIDNGYETVDQALSEISADLDDSAVGRNVTARFAEGFGKQVLSDLSSGRLGGGGTALTGSLENKINEFTKALGQQSDTLQGQAKQAVTTATSSVKTPGPTTGSGPQPPGTTPPTQ